MEQQHHICQSCGMPLNYDPKGGGTNADQSLSSEYCSFCYAEGKFLDEGISLQEKIDKNVRIAMEKMGMPEEKARHIAESVIPGLKRWKM